MELYFAEPEEKPKKEPLKPQSDSTVPKKEVKTPAERKPTKSSDDVSKSKKAGPSKESPSSKDSGSSSESNSKDLKDSKEEKAQTNSDIEKSDKEETTKDSLPKV